MKRAIPIIIGASFAVVAVFGIAAMSHAMGQGDCAASTAQGIACPHSLSPADFMGLHQRFYQMFSSAVFAPLVLAFLLAAVMLLFLASPPDIMSAAVVRFRATESVRPSRSETLMGWLARLEASPNFF